MAKGHLTRLSGSGSNAWGTNIQYTGHGATSPFCAVVSLHGMGHRNQIASARCLLLYAVNPTHEQHRLQVEHVVFGDDAEHT